MHHANMPSSSTPATSSRVPGPARRENQPAVASFPSPPEGISPDARFLYSCIQPLYQEVVTLRQEVALANQRLSAMEQNHQGPAVIESPGVSPIVAEPLFVAEQPEAQSRHSVEDMAVEPSAVDPVSENTLPSLRRSQRQRQNANAAVPPRRPEPQPSTSRQPPPQRPEPAISPSSVEDDEDVPPLARPNQALDYVRRQFPINYRMIFGNVNRDLKITQSQEWMRVYEHVNHETRDITPASDRNFVSRVYGALFGEQLQGEVAWRPQKGSGYLQFKDSPLFKVVEAVVVDRGLMTVKDHQKRWREHINQMRSALRRHRP